MREIKFRGKDKQGRWWKGDLRHTMMILGKPHCRIVNVDKDDYDRLQEIWSYRIQEDTIGQFTGIKDGNGTEIFEGDIIEVTLRHNNTIVSTYNAIVDQKEGGFGFKNKQGFCPFYGQIHENYKVIGNIHDNPELMKGGAQ